MARGAGRVLHEVSAGWGNPRPPPRHPGPTHLCQQGLGEGQRCSQERAALGEGFHRCHLPGADDVPVLQQRACSTQRPGSLH